MPSQQEVTTFTLSFGGVDFCLTPSTAATDVMSISKLCHGEEVIINLNNFVGTLRVTNPASIDAPSNSALPATASPKGKESTKDVMSIAIAEGNEAPNAAVVAQATEAPNPVEDTPSPQAKGYEEGDSTEKPKQRKGQQTLDFFGKKGKKGAAPKLGLVRKTLEPERKKQRKGSKKSEDSPNAADFDDIIDTEAEETGNSRTNSFTFAQSMPSQDNESQIGDGNCDLSLYSQRDTLSIENDQSKPEGVSSIVSKIPIQETSAPCPRWGHTMNMIDNKRFIIYGGQMIEKGSAKPLSDLFIYDLMDHKWTQPINCDGVARTWHTADFLPERQLLLVFGGDVISEKTGKLTTTDQVMVLDCEIMLWYPPSVSGQVGVSSCCVLPPRAYSCFCVKC